MLFPFFSSLAGFITHSFGRFTDNGWRRRFIREFQTHNSQPVKQVMGVQGLWEVVTPAAKPVQLESLRGQRLAVDASIWIYHFMKAVRDGDGNVLRNAHVVGFFRRICKLLYFGIKPVFVFDGGAPSLKRNTISRRKERREFRQEDAARTAAKLLTVQLERLAKDHVTSSKRKKGKGKDREEEDLSDDAVYYEERNLPSSKRTKVTNKKESTPFRPQDPYHLPEMNESKPVKSNDPRLMTEEELAMYSEELQSQLNTGLYDTSKIDFESEYFRALPKATQYQLLTAARFKSRLRMGYTADQLDQKFPDRMEFSKFQVNRVAQRNYLTQSIMNLIGTDDGGAKRISGEKGGEYILNKNERGWTLSLNKDMGINIKEEEKEEDDDEDDDDDEDMEWEDVPIEDDNKKNTEQEDEHSTTTSDGMILPDVLNNVDSRIKREQLYQRNNNNEKNETIQGENTTTPSASDEISEKRKTITWDKSETIFGKSSLLGKKSSNNPTVNNDETFMQQDAASSETQREKNEIQEEEENNNTQQPLPPWFEKKNSEPPEKSTNYNSGSKLLGIQNVETRTEEEQGVDEEIIDSVVSEPIEATKPNNNSEDVLTIGEEYHLIQDIQKQENHQTGAESNNEITVLDDIDKELAEQEAAYQEQEEEDIIESIAKENEENARFTQSLKQPNSKEPRKINDDELENEIKRLQEQKRKDQRDSDEVNSTMIRECQELLQTFGIPYITAPMEAEAQCATLYELDLVDGIITDDSDCFLFGGNKIYKNMFNQSKWVECYDTDTLDKDYNLSRTKLIDLAQLLGSDYTEGLLGIGPVTGMEVLSEFKDLHEFKDWWEKIQEASRKGKISNNNQELLLNNELRIKFKNRFLTKLFLKSDFPSEDVRQAYIDPQVDKDETDFEWGEPDSDAIENFLYTSAGWSKQSVEEVLVPVLRNKNKRQPTIQEFFNPTATSEKTDLNNTSKRMHKAMQNMKRRKKA